MDCPSCHRPSEEGARSCPQCGTSLPLGPGAVVAGRFEILSRLGAGGMGTVFRARDRQLGMDVALKVLKLGQDQLALRRFHSEVRLARAVKHRHVCSVYEYGEDGDVVFFVMELVRGRTLAQLLRQGPLAWDEAFRVALEAAAGLQAIHEAGVIHRDLKTSNLMIDGGGDVRLVDFGIAKAQSCTDERRTSETALTKELEVIGSPEYMSPEQVRGVALDVRSDVYAFGLVLYELFTGRLPFEGTTPRDIMLKRLEQPPSFSGPCAARLPPALVPVLQRALAKDPEARHASMAELAAELAGVQRVVVKSGTEAMLSPFAPTTGMGSPGGEKIAPSVRPRRLWPQRRAPQAAIAAALVLGVGAIVFVATRGAAPATPSARMSLLATPEPAAPVAATPSLASAAHSEEPSARVEPSRSAASLARREPEDRARVVSGAVGASRVAGESPAAPTSRPTSPPAAATSAEERVSPAALPDVRATPAAAAGATPAGVDRTPDGTANTVTRAEPEPAVASPGVARAGTDAPVVPARCTGAEIRYCPQAESLRLEGQIVIEVLVREDGRVSDPQVVRSDDDVLTTCAVRSVARLRCEPATRNGAPVESRRRLLFDFRLPR